MGRSTEWYRNNPEGRAKKQAYDKKHNATASATKKRVESNRKRREAKAAGKDIKGKDYNHGTNSFISVKANRGAKSGTQGDRNARGGSL
jgi:hypothetical protein